MHHQKHISPALVSEKHMHTLHYYVNWPDGDGSVVKGACHQASRILSSEFDLQIYIVEAENCLLQVVLTSPHAP